MANSYKYAVLEAIPDPRKGERVNIGIVVFLPDRIDVRFRAAAPKLRALAGRGWEPDLEFIRRRWIEHFDASKNPNETVSVFQLEDWLRFSELAPIFTTEGAEYEKSVQQILAALVDIPKGPRKAKGTRIKTEITKELNNQKLLAGAEDGLVSHKVVRDYAISVEEELYADFALQNGVFHCISALDLRKDTTKIDEAALKAIVLDKADKEHKDAKTIGIIAMEPDMKDQFKPHVELLGDYSKNGLFNWLILSERKRFLGILGQAVYPAPLF